MFFFNDTATAEIYTLSLHDALPIYVHAPIPEPRHRNPRLTSGISRVLKRGLAKRPRDRFQSASELRAARSEEHTSELQSRQYLVCRLLLEKKIIAAPKT